MDDECCLPAKQTWGRALTWWYPPHQGNWSSHKDATSCGWTLPYASSRSLSSEPSDSKIRSRNQESVLARASSNVLNWTALVGSTRFILIQHRHLVQISYSDCTYIGEGSAQMWVCGTETAPRPREPIWNSPWYEHTILHTATQVHFAPFHASRETQCTSKHFICFSVKKLDSIPTERQKLQLLTNATNS